MSVTIKRTKGGVTHYATSVDAKFDADGSGVMKVTGTGHVTGWSEDRREATALQPELAKHVTEHYRNRANAGTLEFTDAAGKRVAIVGGEQPTGDKEEAKSEAPPRVTAQDAMTAGMAELHNEKSQLTAALARQSRELEESKAENTKITAANKSLTEQNKKLAAENKRLTDENAKLKAPAG